MLIKDLIKRKLISNKVVRLTDFDNLVHMDHNRVVLVGGGVRRICDYSAT